MRERRRWTLLEETAGDLRFAVRIVRANPAYAAIVVLTLAVGIGATTAIFSVVNGVLLRPLANADGDRLLILQQRLTQGTGDFIAFSVPELADYRDQLRSVEAVSELHTMTFNVLGQGEPQEVQAAVVDDRFFDTLGMRPILGRGFTEEENRGVGDAVVVLAHRYWQARFGGDPQVLGKTFNMNGRVHTVIGVLPPIPLGGLQQVAALADSESDLYVPTSHCPIRSSDEFKANREFRMMTAFAKLRRGISLEAAQTEAAAVAGRLRTDYPWAYPEQLGYTATAIPLREALVASSRAPLVLLLATVGALLLVACANVANLSLARLFQREDELRTRSALGAARSRLVRQLLTEAAVMAVLAGIVGFVIAYAGLEVLKAFTSRFSVRAAEVQLDTRILAFTTTLSLLTGVLFGSVPASAIRKWLGPSESARASAAPRTLRLQGALVIVQFAFAFVLLCGAGLLVRSFVLLISTDPGVSAQNVLTLRLAVPINGPQGLAQQEALWTPILERLDAQPEVLSSAVATSAPFDQGSDDQFFSVAYEIVGLPAPSGAERPQAQRRNVSLGYFETLGIPVLAGRAFDDTDGAGGPRVSVVNQAFVERFFGGRNPIGAQVRPCDAAGVCNPAATRQIVGVVGDVRPANLEGAPLPQIYLPANQVAAVGPMLFVRTSGDPLRLVDRLRAIVHEVDRDMPVEDIRTIDMIVDNTLAPRRLTTMFIGLFAGAALAITLAGLASVTAFAVGRRKKEIGIRMALGATGRQVSRMILGRVFLLVAIGSVSGLVITFSAGNLIERFVWGTTPTDPATLVVVSLLFLLASLASTWPALRSIHNNPSEILRAP